MALGVERRLNSERIAEADNLQFYQELERLWPLLSVNYESAWSYSELVSTAVSVTISSLFQ